MAKIVATAEETKATANKVQRIIMDDGFFGTELFGDMPNWADEDTDNIEEATGSPLTLGSQHVLLLIDCHSDMFLPPVGGKEEEESQPSSSAMDLSLQVAKLLLTETIRTAVTLQFGKRNGVGLVLYNTKPRKTNEDIDEDSEEEDDDESGIPRGNTVHVLQELETPGISHVKKLLKCLKNERDLRTEFSFPWDEKNSQPRVSPLQTALEVCIRMFNKAKCVKTPAKAGDPIDSKTIWIFTNREDAASSSHLKLIENVARDAHEQNIDIRIWPLLSSSAPETTTFDYSVFFHSICNPEPAFDERFSSMDELIEGLEILGSSWKRVRRGYHGPMRLPDWRERNNDLAIMVDFFKLVSFKKRPSSIQIDLQSNLETIRQITYIDNELGLSFAHEKRGNTMEKTTEPQKGFDKIHTFCNFVDQELIPFSKKDLKEMRRLCNGQMEGTNLVLWGFKKMDSIPFYHALEGSYFVYPQVDGDKMAKENRTAFANLHSAMLKKRVCAIGEFLGRSIYSSKLVALFPLSEEFYRAKEDSDDGEEEEYVEEEPKQKRPPGLILTPLPFEDDIRELEVDEAMKELRIEVPEDLVMNDIKQEASAPIPVPNTIESDTLDMMKSIASEELVTSAMELIDCQRLEGYEIGDDFDNAVLERFFNYVEDIAMGLNPRDRKKVKFDTEIDEKEILDVAQSEIEKFKALLPDDVKKRAVEKKRKLIPDDSGLDWEQLFRDNEVDSCTMANLKSYLRSVGAPLTGKKYDLVDRVKNLLLGEIECNQNQKGRASVKMEI